MEKHIPHLPRQFGAAALLSIATLLVAGCGHHATQIAPDTVEIPAGSRQPAAVLDLQGRIALTVEAENLAAEPGAPGSARHFSAGFELRGNGAEGQMRLASPLRSQLALLTWSAAGAWLHTGGNAVPQAYPSLDSLLQELTGTSLPASALFAWLRGEPVAVQGWTVDLRGYAGPGSPGRISAERITPKPAASLRLVLE